MISIPEELLEQIARGNVLLFIGERILRDASGQVLVDRMALDLARRTGAKNPEQYSFPEAAQVFENEFGRNTLVRFVKDQLEGLDNKPRPIHRLIAKLEVCHVLVTTGVDQRLEQAFAQIGRPLDVVVGNKEVPFVDDRKAQLYKLRGSIDRIESLVLTENDYETFFENQTSLSIVLQSYLARKTVLFVGYDLADPNFKQLYRKVTAPLDGYARRAYAFGAVPTNRVAHWCKYQGIEVIDVRATAFVEALTLQLNRFKARTQSPDGVRTPVPAEQVVRPLPDSPYKFLDFYDTGDEHIFFGRNAEKQQLTSLIHAHRLTLLYGASGTGKTSLLLAGVQPSLQKAEPPYEMLYVRALADPARTIRRTIRRRLPEVDLPEDGALVDYLGAAAVAWACTIVLIFDQFEELFIGWSQISRQAFIAELVELYEARDVPVKIVLSLREDWLASLSELEGGMLEVYRTRMRLLSLSRDQARQAIIAPLAPLEMYYEPALVDTLLDDLVGEPAGDSGATVLPPRLQLVCHRLYEPARAENRETITLTDYENLGGAEGILTRYLETALLEHPGQDRVVAKAVLLALVTSQATRSWAGLERITAEVKAEASTVERVLSRFIGQRLVRRLDEGGSYELAHDILAGSISTWISEADRRLKQARELLRREVADWQQDPTILPGQSKFRRIDAVRISLQPTELEAGLLLRAALLYNEAIPYWLDQAGEPEVQATILLEMLGSESDQARLGAATQLAAFGQKRVVFALARAALEDREPRVRDVAAVSLGQAGLEAGLEHLIEAIAGAESQQRRRAVRALALIRETVPRRPAVLTGSIGRQVTIELAKIRFWRSWPRIRRVTAAGAGGGAIAFGLGLSLPLMWHTVVVMGSDSQSFIDFIFIIPMLAVFGLVAGAALAFGLSLGEAVLGQQPAAGRIVGGTLLGGLGFAAALSPLAIVDAAGLFDALRVSLGAWLLGGLTGLFITLPALMGQSRALTLGGGALGGALGVLLFGVLGFDAFEIGPAASVPLFILLAAGGLTGLILAASLTWAAQRWTLEEREQAAAEQTFRLRAS